MKKLFTIALFFLLLVSSFSSMINATDFNSNLLNNSTEKGEAYSSTNTFMIYGNYHILILLDNSTEVDQGGHYSPKTSINISGKEVLSINVVSNYTTFINTGREVVIFNKTIPNENLLVLKAKESLKILLNGVQVIPSNITSYSNVTWIPYGYTITGTYYSNSFKKLYVVANYYNEDNNTNIGKLFIINTVKMTIEQNYTIVGDVLSHVSVTKQSSKDRIVITSNTGEEYNSIITQLDYDNSTLSNIYRVEVPSLGYGSYVIRMCTNNTHIFLMYEDFAEDYDRLMVYNPISKHFTINRYTDHNFNSNFFACIDNNLYVTYNNSTNEAIQRYDNRFNLLSTKQIDHALYPYQLGGKLVVCYAYYHMGEDYTYYYRLYSLDLSSTSDIKQFTGVDFIPIPIKGFYYLIPNTTDYLLIGYASDGTKIENVTNANYVNLGENTWDMSTSDNVTTIYQPIQSTIGSVYGIFKHIVNTNGYNPGDGVSDATVRQILFVAGLFMCGCTVLFWLSGGVGKNGIYILIGILTLAIGFGLLLSAGL